MRLSRFVACVLAMHMHSVVMGMDCQIDYLKPGPTVCEEPHNAEEPNLTAGVENKPNNGKPGKAAASKPAAVIIGGVSEESIDEFLKNHGKPPREFVRALLNPIDDNIRAYDQKLKAELALVNYLSDRQTELTKNAKKFDYKPNKNIKKLLPFFNGVELYLIIPPRCNDCISAIKNVQQFTSTYPTVVSTLITRQFKYPQEVIDFRKESGAILRIEQDNDTVNKYSQHPNAILKIVDKKSNKQSLKIAPETQNDLIDMVVEFGGGIK